MFTCHKVNRPQSSFQSTWNNQTAMSFSAHSALVVLAIGKYKYYYQMECLYDIYILATSYPGDVHKPLNI